MDETTATMNMKDEQQQRDAEEEAWRLQLMEDGAYYRDNWPSGMACQRLLQTMQTKDCRRIVSMSLDGDVLGDVFVCAAERNQCDLLQALLDNQINVNIKRGNGWTALMIACEKGNDESVRLLLDHNADVNVQNKHGNTALIIAGIRDFTSIVHLLLQKNADPDLPNSNGMTAFMYACQDNWNNKMDIIELLLNYNANMELKNKKGKTALELTTNEDVRKFLQNHVDTGYVLK